MDTVCNGAEMEAFIHCSVFVSLCKEQLKYYTVQLNLRTSLLYITEPQECAQAHTHTHTHTHNLLYAYHALCTETHIH